jgi:hypothetical protein
VFELTKPPPAVNLAARTLTRAEEHSLQAILWQSCYRCRASDRGRWKQEVQLAIAADPTETRALVMASTLQMFEPNEGFERALALVRAHSESWLSWVALGVAASRAEKLDEVIGHPDLDPGLHAFQLAPKQPYAVLAQAASHVQRGERELAIAMALRAQRLQPTNESALLLAAEVLALVSACQELKHLVQQIDLPPDSRRNVAIRRRLNKLTARCDS